MITHDVIDSPIGPLTCVMDRESVVRIAMDRQRHLPSSDAFGPRVAGCASEAAAQLDAYFAGTLEAFSLELRPRGTAFQEEVWGALRAIPYGATTTYGELAGAIGRPKAARAIGAAVGRNPISIVVPCHRVVGSDGSLTGFAGGIDRKRFLLELEHGASSES